MRAKPSYWLAALTGAWLMTGNAFSAQQPAPALGPQDLSKGKIERGPHQVLAQAQAAQFAKALATQAKAAQDNPKVEPGKVKWHANLANACKASAASGKPVMIFYMMGKLDDKFC
jgi:hypothetical protein